MKIPFQLLRVCCFLPTLLMLQKSWVNEEFSPQDKECTASIAPNHDFAQHCAAHVLFFSQTIVPPILIW